MSYLSKAFIFALLACLFIGSIDGLCKTKWGKTCQEKAELKKANAPKSYLTMFRNAKNGSPCFTYGTKNYCFVDWTAGRLARCDPERSGCTGNGELGVCEKAPTSKDCYCDIDEAHTMCMYSGVDVAKCGNILWRDVKQEEKDAIVAKHNDLRRKVAKGQELRGVGDAKQPPATNMYKLKWNDELASVAQRWADQCFWAHDNARGTMQFSSVGQNIAMYSFSREIKEPHFDVLIEGWYNEVKDFPAAKVGAFKSKKGEPVIGHYTQVVWALTKEVGCGIMVYNPKPNEYIEYLVCNYGPSGNFGGKPVYIAGETASGCPNGDDDGLCI